MTKEKSSASVRPTKITYQKLMGQSWANELYSGWELQHTEKYHEQLHKEKICPRPANIFRALKEVPINKVRVVILAQDPYYTIKNGVYAATGLAFDNPIELPPSPSLANIFKEMGRQIPERAVGDVTSGYQDSYLEHLPSQGVLLLNVALTTKLGTAGAHFHIWKPLTTRIVELVNQENRPIVWLLWGNHAQGYEKYITNEKHLILKSSHPSPLGYNKTDNPFKGCDHFNKANEFLKNKIQW